MLAALDRMQADLTVAAHGSALARDEALAQAQAARAAAAAEAERAEAQKAALEKRIALLQADKERCAGPFELCGCLRASTFCALFPSGAPL